MVTLFQGPPKNQEAGEGGQAGESGYCAESHRVRADEHFPQSTLTLYRSQRAYPRICSEACGPIRALGPKGKGRVWLEKRTVGNATEARVVRDVAVTVMLAMLAGPSWSRRAHSAERGCDLGRILLHLPR